MTVPEGKRTESKLAVQTKAIELAEHTIHICSNEKVFPKRYRWCLTGKIVDIAIEIANDINTANSIYVSAASDYELRRSYQTNALARTARMLGMMQIAYKMFKIAGNRMVHWTQLVVDLRELLKKWKKSDRQRYSKYLKD